jgi:hypothetical protein
VVWDVFLGLTLCSITASFAAFPLNQLLRTIHRFQELPSKIDVQGFDLDSFERSSLIMPFGNPAAIGGVEPMRAFSGIRQTDRPLLWSLC